MSAQPFSPNNAQQQPPQSDHDPRETPHLYRQAYRDTYHQDPPEHMGPRRTPPPGYGQRARYTIPMVQGQEAAQPSLEYFPELSEDSEVGFREICGNCGGNGTVHGAVVRCKDVSIEREQFGNARRHECRSIWSRETVFRFARYKGFRDRIMILPCGHDIEVKVLAMSWQPPICRICKGEGTLTRWVRFRDVVSLLARLYPDEPEHTTEVIRAFSQAHHRDDFARSGEPTVTAPPQSPLYHSGGSITPNLGTNILEFDSRAVSPHLPPVSPYNSAEDDRSF